MSISSSIVESKAVGTNRTGGGTKSLIYDQATVVAQDATKKSFTVDFDCPGGRIAIGVVTDTSFDASTFSIALTGETTQNLQVDDDQLANLDSSYFEDGVIFDTDAGRKTLTVTASTGNPDIEGVIIRFPNRIGLVEDQGTGTHCAPLSCVYGGDRYQVHSEIYTANVYATKNGKAPVKIFDGIAADRNEHYHNGVFVLPLTTGLLFGMVGHNQPYIYLVYAASADLTSLSPVRQYGDAASKFTYSRAVADASNNVFILTRADSSGSNKDLVVVKITNATSLDTETPTGTFDVVARQPASIYPRHFEVIDHAGSEFVIGILWNGRASDSDWDTVHAAIFAPDLGTAGRYYNLRGHAAAGSGDSLGTETNSRFSSSQETTQTNSGDGTMILNFSSGQRYAPPCAIFKLEREPTASVTAQAAMFCFFIDNAESDATDYGDSDVRTCIFTGSTAVRKVSPADVAVPTLSADPNSYRVDAAMVWKDGDYTTDVAYLMITDRGDRTKTNNYAETTDLYYDWGGTSIRIFEVDEPTSVANISFTLLETLNFYNDLTAAFITAVRGANNQFIFQAAKDELHPTHRQPVNRLYEVNA